MENFFIKAPPDRVNASLAHRVDEFYRQIYSLASKIDKRNKFGIWLRIENTCLEIIYLIIKASFTNKNSRSILLESARVEIEVLKRLVRIAYELKIIESGIYLQLESNLQEISKMTNGWIRYLTQKEL
ncbi:MAG: four helix bundle protein [Patescibacteria group bacterium]